MKEYVMLGIVVALLLISVTQTMQINEMKQATENVVYAEVTKASQAAQTNTQSSSTTQKTTQTLPAMVGGC